MTTIEPGPDLARAQGTDFFSTEDWLTGEERAIRDRVRTFVDEKLVPVAARYWEAAEFPRELIEPYAALKITGGGVQGYGCHYNARSRAP